MIRLTVLTLFATAITASTASAQALPITKRVVSQEELAQAIEKDDRTVFNVPCASYVAAVNQLYPDIATSYGPVNTCPRLATYVRKALQEVPCPPHQATMARVMPNGSIDTVGWTRQLRSGPDGERCLYDPNRAQWFAPLSCANLIVTRLPAFHSEDDTKPPATPLADAGKKAASAPASFVGGHLQQTLEPRPSAKSRRWYDPRGKRGLLLWSAVGAGVGVAACNIPEPRCFTTRVTVIQTVTR